MREKVNTRGARVNPSSRAKRTPRACSFGARILGEHLGARPRRACAGAWAGKR